MKSKVGMVLVGLALAATASWAAPTKQKFEVVPAESQVTFNAIGKPSALKIVGKAESGPTGTAWIEGGKLKGEFRFDLKSLKTGISLRDNHMKDKYLEVGKHPDAVLKLDETAFAPGQKNVEFTGKLLLHGVEKPVRGTATIEQGDGSAKVTSDFELKISDFAISVPSFAGITVTDSVKVNVSLLAKPSAP